MGRQRRLVSIVDYVRALKDGYGIGAGEDYRPWIRVNDVSRKKSKAVKIYGIKTNRTHHLLSGIEEYFFYYAELNQLVIDIREQFPLFPLDLVVRIAQEAGITYPFHQKSGDPCVLSTDFLLTLRNNGVISYLAVAIKTAEDLEDLDVLVRLEIERLWWTALQIPWRLVTEEQISKEVARNLAWVSDPLRGSKSAQFGEDSNSLLSRIVNILEPGLYLWEELIEQISTDLELSPIITKQLLKVAIWKKLISVDLSALIQETQYLSILSIPSSQENLFNGTVSA